MSFTSFLHLDQSHLINYISLSQSIQHVIFQRYIFIIHIIDLSLLFQAMENVFLLLLLIGSLLLRVHLNVQVSALWIFAFVIWVVFLLLFNNRKLSGVDNFIKNPVAAHTFLLLFVIFRWSQAFSTHVTFQIVLQAMLQVIILRKLVDGFHVLTPLHVCLERLFTSLHFQDLWLWK